MNDDQAWQQPGSGDGLGPGPAGAPQGGGPGAGRGRERSGLGSLWLMLVPVACCGAPLLIAGLAAAGALAWGGVGLAAAVVVGGAVLLVTRRRRRACGGGSPAGQPEAGTTAWRSAGR